MGLDSYFYRHTKVKECDDVLAADMVDIFNSNKKLQKLLMKLKAHCRHKDVPMSDALADSVKDYLNRNGEGYDDEILYFRKLHFLNDYFNYDDSWYAKDMTITKEQCIDLRDRAKRCLDECEEVYKKSDLYTRVYRVYRVDEPLRSTRNYERSFDDDTDIGKAVNEICKKHFPSKYSDSCYDKIGHLYQGMNSIIEGTDWENESIIYNADW